MKRLSSILLIAGLALWGLCGTGYADDVARSIIFEDIRAQGMGGAGLTLLDNFSAVVYNPASIAKARTSLDLASVQAGMARDIIDLLKFIDDNQDLFENFTDTTEEAQNELLDGITEYDENWMGVNAYPAVGLIVPHFAVGVYGSGRVDFRLDKGIFEPRIFMEAYADRVITGGLALTLPKSLHDFILPNNLYAGAALKLIERREVVMEVKASDADFDTALDSLKENAVNGYSVDLGLLYELKPQRARLGVTIVDFMSDLDGESMPTLVNAGFSYHYGRLVLAADYHDVLAHYENNAFNRLYFGAELNVGRVLFLRGGVGQGYPSVGAGINLAIVKLDAAIYGFERSTSPGLDGDYNYSVRLRVGF